MVSIKGAFVASLAIIKAVSAVYTNDTIQLPSQKLVGSTQSSIARVQIIDTLTNSQVSHNLANWFAVVVDVAMEPGSSTLNITFPTDFNSFPQTPINLMDGCNVVGSVSYDKSNVFTVSFSNNTKRRIASFNVLSKLNITDLNEFDRPRVIDYTFDISKTVKFLSSIHYEEDTMERPTSFAGSDADGKAWFAVDIPLSVYPGELTLEATADGSGISYDKNLTEVFIVTDVNTLRQPIKTIPLKSFDDFSDANSIKLYIDNKISGAEFIRIKYYADIKVSKCIQNTAVLTYASRDDSEQILSKSLVDMICMESVSNVQLPIKEGTIAISPVCRPGSKGVFVPEEKISKNKNSNMVAVNSTSSSEMYYFSSNSPSNSTTFSSHADVNSSIVPANRTAQSSSLVSPRLSFTSNLTTSARVPDILTTSLVYPVSTNATTGISQYTTKAMTYKVLTLVKEGKTVEYKSWFPIATNLPANVSSNYTYIPLESESPTLVTSNRTVNVHATSAYVSNFTAYEIPVTASNIASNVSKTAADMAYTVLTFVQGGKTVEYTSWFPIKTLLPFNSTSTSNFSSKVTGNLPSVTSNKTALAHATAAPFINSTTYQLPVNSTELSQIVSKTAAAMSYRISTTIKDGKTVKYTSWFPIYTLAYPNSTFYSNSSAKTDGGRGYTGMAKPFINSTHVITVSSTRTETVTCQTCVVETNSQTAPAVTVLEPQEAPIPGTSAFVESTPVLQSLVSPHTTVSSSSSPTIESISYTSSSVVEEPLDQSSTHSPKYIGGASTNRAAIPGVLAAFLMVFL